MPRRAAAEPLLEPLLTGLDGADAFELDARLRRAVALEQRLEAEIAPLLLAVATARSYRDLGFRSLEQYARERLGLSPRKARMLLRLARAPRALRDAWQAGRLSWVQAHALVPVLALAPGHVRAWASRARRTTVRRLEDDVDAALTLAEADPVAFETTAGLPDAEPAPAGRQTGAQPTRASQGTLHWSAPRPATRFFRAVLCSVQRRLGCPPGEAFAAMLDHAIATWSLRDGRLRRSHRVFERDGWRCTVPGCRSYRNLHDHHVVFRSAGGSDALDNRVTLCAWHHLRGVHAGQIRIRGRAPEGLAYELPTGTWSADEVRGEPVPVRRASG